MMVKLKKKNLPRWLPLMVALLLVVIIVSVALISSNRSKLTLSTPQPSASPTPTVGPGAAGTSQTGTSTPTPTTAPVANPTATPAPLPLAAPTGQVLNKGDKNAQPSEYISLSSTQPQFSPEMVSTCYSLPGATCEVQAYTDINNPITVAGPSLVSSDNYFVELDWNAAAKLAVGDWQVRLVARIGNKVGYSAPYTLEIRK
ncbi:hypothetical protein HJC99_03785 [Candidatus Saccharibacteria bacterium]|nr:hypothetical protein [Candidatus Saccharibacteria bacterium]